MAPLFKGARSMLIKPLANGAMVRRPRDPFTSLVRYSVAWAVAVLAPLLAFWISGYEEPFADPTLRATILAGSAALLTGLFLAGRVLDLPGTRLSFASNTAASCCFTRRPPPP